MHKYYAGIGALGILVVFSVIMGAIIAGSPFEQQAKAYDARRLDAFRFIDYAVQKYYLENHKLPASLSQISATPQTLKDPENKKNYDYQIVSPASYKLCTVFATDNSTGYENTGQPQPFGTNPNNLRHKKGYDCLAYFLPQNVLPSPTPPLPTTTSCPSATATGVVSDNTTTFLKITYTGPNASGNITIPKSNDILSTNSTKDLKIGDRVLIKNENCQTTVLRQ